ncbi:HAD-like protein [Gymnopus androsaceus JB14]|uniref:HAD-like protein n=1 Tax=Gymnopus androsaceus JB14 TaxID=1447944 RepID=A0A6A4HH28_9AGAR|nr:HAD-like protein [Gymnopus androsaceus JB14]
MIPLVTCTRFSLKSDPSVSFPLARAGIKLVDFKPFNPVDKRTEITYREESSGKLKRVTKGMTGIIIELCSRNKSDDLENRLEADVEEYATRGLRALAVAYEELDGDDHEAEGNDFELIGLLAIFDPPREDTKQTIDDALSLGVKVKMVTGDQLAIAKETGRRLGLGDHMYPAKVLKDGPAPGSKHASLDEMIMDADGFAGVFPEHKYEIVKRLQGLGHLCAMTGDGANDAPALSRANVARSFNHVHAIRGSRIIFQRMRNYAIYACAVTIRIVVCFAILAWVYQFDFPPFMVLIIALLNDVSYLLCSLTETTFFQDKFSVTLLTHPVQLQANDEQLHAIVYLQVAIISQALIFVTRSHGFFFMERPSYALMAPFVSLSSFHQSLLPLVTRASPTCTVLTEDGLELSGSGILSGLFLSTGSSLR